MAITVHEMKKDMVARINSLDESNEEQVKNIWLYLMKIPAPKTQDQDLTTEQRRRLALVKKHAGAFAVSKTDKDWKEVKEEYLIEKYG